MIKPFKILHNGHMGLHILSLVKFHPSVISTPLIPFCGQTYTHQEWIRLTPYLFSMSTYGMYRNLSTIEGNDHNYIDG